MQNSIKKLGMLLGRIADKLVLAIGMVMMLALSYFSMRYTETVQEPEIMKTFPDSPIANIAALAGVVLLAAAVRKAVFRDEERSRRWMKIFLAAVLVFMAGASIWWAGAAHVLPDADQISVCVVANYLNAHEYSVLDGGYMRPNPHQYGIVSLLQLIFALFGDNNYLAFEYLNALCIPLLVYAGYRAAGLLWDNRIIQFYYLVGMLLFLPVYFYVPFVYGEIISLTMCMVLVWQVLFFCRTQKKSALIWAAAAAAAACLVKKNSLIFIVAVVILLLLYGMREFNMWAVFAVALLMISAWAPIEVIKAVWENVSGIEIAEGIPSVSFIAMGLQDTEEGPGWFNSLTYNGYMDSGCSTERTAWAHRAVIKERLGVFWQDKRYAVDFFRRKILTQWNAPEYHWYFSTAHFDCETEELPEPVQAVYSEQGRKRIGSFLDRYQFVLYAGVVFSLLFWSGERKIERHVLLVTVIGGMLFSILWEAKPRYVLPYAVCMIPLASAGIYYVQDKLGQGLRALKGRLGKK